MNERYKDLEQIKEVFDKFNVKLIVVYGLLLGMYRDGKPIEHDEDIDLAVIEPIDLKTRKDIGWMLHSLGFVRQHIGFNVFGRMEGDEEGYNGTEDTGILVIERNFKFTIFFFQEEDCEKHGKEYVCIPKLGAVKLISTPKKFFELHETIKINGKKYLTPCPIKDYLEFTYKNWKSKTDRDHGETYPTAHQ